MLTTLKVLNFALIDELSVSFKSGLNVLSGETGAGKSIVIGALNLLLGERAMVDSIRQGNDFAYVEGLFIQDLPLHVDLIALFDNAGMVPSEDLIVAREIYRNGRSVARVDGRAVPVSFLKELGKYLVDLHGQHQHQSLLRAEQHLELLDAYGGNRLLTARDEISELYRQREQLKSQLSQYGSDNSERERQLDILEFQLQEINDAQIKAGEDEELKNREKLLANAEKLYSLTNQAYQEIYSGDDEGNHEAIVDKISSAIQALRETVNIDQQLEPLLLLLNEAAAQLDEVAHELRAYQSSIEFEPQELTTIQERVNLINTLKRKYGSTVEEVLQFAKNVEAEIDKLNNSTVIIEGLEHELNSLEELLKEKSLALRNIRHETAEVLEKLLEESLSELALTGARFAVALEPKNHFSSLGMDQVEFLFSANKGEAVKPLAKIISGGEVARVMLAMKAILARQDLVPTLVFDEVDAGIGGSTIQSVAEKLSQLSTSHQVMCVTHSPQIAVMADHHVVLYKETIDERTVTKADELISEDRKIELARMLDGASIDAVSLRHVDALLARAERFKAGSVGT